MFGMARYAVFFIHSKMRMNLIMVRKKDVYAFIDYKRGIYPHPYLKSSSHDFLFAR